MNQFIKYDEVKTATKVLRALNHKLRQQIIKLIDENKRLNVTDIYVKLRLEQSVASQHLAILRNAGIIAPRREGRERFYSLNYGNIHKISTLVADLVSIDDTTTQLAE